MQDQSIDDQKKAITQFAEKNGVGILKWYEDEDRSGTSIVRRRGFQTLKSVVDQNKHDFSEILIYDVTRWGRFPDPRESIYWEVYFEKRGVTVIYVCESFKSDQSFETAIVKTVKHAAAGDFSRRLSLLTTRGSRTTAEKGFWNGSGAPYAYKRAEVDDEKNIIRILEKGEKCRPDHRVMLVKGDPGETEVVQRIFDCYLNRGMGCKAVAHMLNSEGIPSAHKGRVKCFKNPDGSWEHRANQGEWGISQIWRILTNPVYTGTLVWGKLKGGVFSRAENTWEDVNGSLTIHDKDKWVVCEDAHEALISKEVFSRVQELRKSKNYFRPSGDGRTYGSTYLLTGLLVCGHCEHKFHGHTHRNGDRVYRYYEDGGFYYKGSSVCQSMHIRKELVDKFVLEKIGKKLSNPRLFPLFEDRLRKKLREMQSKREHQPEDIEGKIKDVDTRIDNLLDLVERGRISDRVKDRLKKLQAEKERLTALREKTVVEYRAEMDVGEIVEAFRLFLQDGTKVLDAGTDEEKKLLIRKFVREAVVDRDANRVRFSFYRLPPLPVCASYSDRGACGEVQGTLRAANRRVFQRGKRKGKRLPGSTTGKVQR
jgi:DNA invertase Pin-like site-specific DNA recombinase